MLIFKGIKYIFKTIFTTLAKICILSLDLVLPTSIYIKIKYPLFYSIYYPYQNISILPIK